MEIENLIKQDIDKKMSYLYNNEDIEDMKRQYFYKNKDGSYLPYYKGDIESCINDFYPESIIKILKIMNYPFFEEEWLKLLKRNIIATIKNNRPYKTIFGRYISTMNLAGYKNCTFIDSIYNKNIKYYNLYDCIIKEEKE